MFNKIKGNLMDPAFLVSVLIVAIVGVFLVRKFVAPALPAKAQEIIG